MPRKILYVSPCAERAGAEQLTKLFIVNHDRNKWLPEILFLKDGPFAQELADEGIICHVLSEDRCMRLRDPLSVLATARKIAAVVREREIELVHSVMGYGHIAGGLGARLAGVPEVWFQHGPTGLLDYLTGLVPSQSVLVNSEYTRSCQRRYRARVKRTRLIYPPIDPKQQVSAYSEAASRLRSVWGCTEKSFVFGLIGRLAPMKGQEVFAQAAELVAAQFSEARFALIGSTFEGSCGRYARRLQARIESCSFRDRWIMTGYLPCPQPAILATDCVVNASVVPEPFGLTLIEAMQMGRTVIAPGQGGPLEIFEDNRHGFFFEAGDPVALAAAMIRMIHARKDTQRWAKMQESGQAHVVERFDVVRTIRALEAEYERACQEPTI